MRKEKYGVTDLVTEIKHMGNYHDYEKIGAGNSA